MYIHVLLEDVFGLEVAVHNGDLYIYTYIYMYIDR